MLEVALSQRGMGEDKGQVVAHPAGEATAGCARTRRRRPWWVYSWAGRIKVEWDPQAPLTPLGRRELLLVARLLRTSTE